MTIGVLEPGLETVALGVLMRELVDTVGLFEAILKCDQNNELQLLVSLAQVAVLRYLLKLLSARAFF